MATDHRCPVCKAEVAAGDERPASFPFCSRRCRDRDLGNWFAGAYAVPAEPAAPGDQEAAIEAVGGP